MSKIVDDLKQYLLGQENEFDEAEFNNKSQGCFKNTLERIFDCNILCSHYDQVINGQGSEKEKITSVYSSSLQSLLFFSQVSDKKPLEIGFDKEVISFVEVYFEVKNKVTGYPSSVDVVLVDKDKKHILFIESKLAEIVRESQVKKDPIEKSGTKVIGITYFSDKDSGYKNALKLSYKDLIDMGILPPMSECEYPLKKLEKCDSRIVPIKNNEYVYSYGIKQMLAHLIGIQNFKKQQFHSEELSEYASDAKLYYMEIYNKMPGIQNDDVEIIHTNFVNHVKEVKRIIDGKNLGIDISIMTYQDLYKKATDYKLSAKVERFYHLEK